MTKVTALLSTFLTYLFVYTDVLAQDELNIRINTPAGVNPPGSLADVVGIVVRAFFLIGGIGVIIMLLWGAVEWIFSGGSKEKIDGARKRIINALIGLAILALAFLIARVIGGVVGFNPLNPPNVPSRL